MEVHRLKCFPENFKAVLSGDKKFEIRLNDRNFDVGDTLVLQEYDQNIHEYSGRSLNVKVTYILYEFMGLYDDYCIISVELLNPPGTSRENKYFLTEAAT